jgi:SAM-dependent methyltransferase
VDDAVHAARARSFGPVADVYERARPDYAPAAVAWALERAPGPRTVDLAAGTGKLTRALVAAGADAVAVEPSEGMRAAFARAVPDVAVVDGSAESIPLPDASADALVVGQAFHWFDPGAALEEIARVLVPDGVLGLLWNMRDESEPWVLELSRILEFPADTVAAAEHVGDEAVRRHPAFEGAARRIFPNPQPYDAERLVAWAASTSRVAVLGPDQRAARLEAVAELAATHPGLRGRAAFALPFATVAVRARRRRR